MPYVDIYALSDHRNVATLEPYFTHFGDRAALEPVPADYEIYPRTYAAVAPNLYEAALRRAA